MRPTSLPVELPVGVSRQLSRRFIGVLALSWCIGAVLPWYSPAAFGNPKSASKQLEIMSLKRINQFDRNDEGCDRWKMSKLQVLQAFKRMRETSSGWWGSVCEAYSCAYTGQAKYDGRLYEIEVNAASVIKLFDEKRTLYFIDAKRRPYFLAACQPVEGLQPREVWGPPPER